jgi:hypothetical protein
MMNNEIPRAEAEHIRPKTKQALSVNPTSKMYNIFSTAKCTSSKSMKTIHKHFRLFSLRKPFIQPQFQ